jgi:hypothetical protein
VTSWPAAVAAGTAAGHAIAILASAPSITLGSLRSPGLHEALERAELPIVNAAWRAFAKPIDNGNGGEVRFGCSHATMSVTRRAPEFGSGRLAGAGA